jgi:hypothetical protein
MKVSKHGLEKRKFGSMPAREDSTFFNEALGATQQRHSSRFGSSPVGLRLRRARWVAFGIVLLNPSVSSIGSFWALELRTVVG